MPKATCTPFKHEPIDQTRPSIRLVRVLPIEQSGKIRCEMIHSTTSAKYTCLSYVWGQPDDGLREIFINDQRFPVRHNLHTFLKVAQIRYSSIMLWIDALCIDQANTEERNHQVQQMGDIYSRAAMVVAWLGDQASVEVALASLQVAGTRWPILNTSRRLRNLAKQQDGTDKKSFLFALKEYWSRAWITQEIALATRVKLLARETEWDLSRASGNGLFRARKSLRHDETISQVTSLATEQYDSGGKSLLGLLSRFRDRQCSVRRDRIFSLLSLCSEGSRIHVDYGISDLQLLYRVLDASPGTSCLCSAAIVVHALDLTALISDEPRLMEEFAEFDTRGVYNSPLSESSLIKCNLCWSDLGSSWHEHQIVFFCLSSVCQDISGHLIWEQASPSHNAGVEANLGRVYYTRAAKSLEGGFLVKPVGQMGELVQIAPSADGQTYTIRLTLRALLEVFVGWYTPSRPPVPCELSFRNYGRRMWRYETSES
jgi:hypothetical protein